jgi:hypothetical protein
MCPISGGERRDRRCQRQGETGVRAWCGLSLYRALLQDDWTPLHWAAHGGYLSCIQLLVEKGATVDTKNKVAYFSRPIIVGCRLIRHPISDDDCMFLFFELIHYSVIYHSLRKIDLVSTIHHWCFIIVS